MRVLLAEDDAVLAEVALEALGDDGHTVTHVTTLADARKLAAVDQWDVLIVDGFGPSYDRPAAEEREALVELASHGRVVLATCRPWATEVRPEDLGVTAVLSKPYDLDRLLETVRSR
ncbi:MAG: hypothetical protein HY718_15050 [Planctomycetes bacterium]|nr:hypothetical protein [Planctomycetota bacterium]